MENKQLPKTSLAVLPSHGSGKQELITWYGIPGIFVFDDCYVSNW